MATTSWMKTIDASGLDVEALRALVQAEMADALVLRLRGATPVGEPLPFWRSVGEVLGASCDVIEDSVTGQQKVVPGAWMDVRFEPERPDTYRHHKVGQPLHSDGAYTPLEHAQEFALFYLERQAPAGGESIFVDAASVAQRARVQDPLLYSALTSLPLQFGKVGAGRTSTILSIRDGRRKINWNYFRVLSGQGEAVDCLREKFRRFLQEMVEEGAVACFRLEEGDALFFRDEEVLHGRRDFEAQQSGDRLLWKTYFMPMPQVLLNQKAVAA
jgi:alpha-ketoglutarate-dependent taurine dioxygenase